MVVSAAAAALAVEDSVVSGAGGSVVVGRVEDGDSPELPAGLQREDVDDTEQVFVDCPDMLNCLVERREYRLAMY